jgi:hypothetical protein
MGNSEAGLLDDEIFIQEKIEIDRAGPPPFEPLAMQGVFNRREHAEQLGGGEFRLDEEGPVHEGSLTCRATHGASLTDSAGREECQARHRAEQIARIGKMLPWLSFIRTARDEASCHGPSPW